jgi:hypothetical protein
VSTLDEAATEPKDDGEDHQNRTAIHTLIDLEAPDEGPEQNSMLEVSPAAAGYRKNPEER